MCYYICFDFVLHHLFISLLLFCPSFFLFFPLSFSSLIPVLYLYLYYYVIIYLCNFFNCPILEKDSFIEHLYIVLSFLFKVVFHFNLVSFVLYKE